MNQIWKSVWQCVTCEYQFSLLLSQKNSVYSAEDFQLSYVSIWWKSLKCEMRQTPELFIFVKLPGPWGAQGFVTMATHVCRDTCASVWILPWFIVNQKIIKSSCKMRAAFARLPALTLHHCKTTCLSDQPWQTSSMGPIYITLQGEGKVCCCLKHFIHTRGKAKLQINTFTGSTSSSEFELFPRVSPDSAFLIHLPWPFLASKLPQFLRPVSGKSTKQTVHQHGGNLATRCATHEEMLQEDVSVWRCVHGKGWSGVWDVWESNQEISPVSGEGAIIQTNTKCISGCIRAVRPDSAVELTYLTGLSSLQVTLISLYMRICQMYPKLSKIENYFSVVPSRVSSTAR